EYAAAGTVSQNYASILLMLLRLRQACDHPLLVKGFNPNSSRRLLLELLHRLETSCTICRLCSDPPEDAVVTKCGHIFCYQCVADYLSGDNNTCPGLGCKKHVSDDVIFSSTTLRSCLSDDAGTPNDDLPDRSSLMMSNAYSSSKIRAALEILQSHAKSRTKFVDPDDSDGSDEDFMEMELQPRKRSSSKLPIKTI
ncbi:Helicase-like transcription factor CHR28-like protein, partial [Drosera capensis]